MLTQADRWDEKEEFPRDVLVQLAELGFAGIPFAIAIQIFSFYRSLKVDSEDGIV